MTTTEIILLNSNSNTLLIFFGYKGQNTKHIFWKVTKVTKIQISRLANNKLGHRNKFATSQCSKIESQSVSQLGAHHRGPKFALAFNSNNVSELLSESLLCFVKWIMPPKLSYPNCISNTNYAYAENVIEIQNAKYSSKPVKYELQSIRIGLVYF